MLIDIFSSTFIASKTFPVETGMIECSKTLIYSLYVTNGK